MKQTGIYQIRNLVNDKIYLGRSVDLEKRKKQHFYTLSKGNHANIILQKAYAKYGRDNFVFEVIEYCTPDEARVIEQGYLDSLDTDRSYNISASSDGGDTKRNHPNKKDWCVNHSKTIKALWEKEPERNLEFQAASREYWDRPENRNRLVDSWSGNNNPMAGSDRKGESNPFYGKKQSQEVIDKIRLVHTGRKDSPETCARKVLARQCTYIVNGKPYDRILDIQNDLGVSWKYASRRLNSSDFKDWVVVYP